MFGLSSQTHSSGALYSSMWIIPSTQDCTPAEALSLFSASTYHNRGPHVLILGNMASHITCRQDDGMPSEVPVQRKSSIEAGGMNSLKQEGLYSIN